VELDTKRVTEIVCKYLRGQGHWAVIPNVYIVRGVEVDIFSIKVKNVIDVEVKISRGDFARDIRKRKHRMIKRGKYPANFFYYACPAGLIQPSECPKYAGLLWIYQDGTVRRKKEPKRIQRRPQRDKVLLRVTQKLDKRYRKLSLALR